MGSVQQTLCIYHVCVYEHIYPLINGTLDIFMELYGTWCPSLVPNLYFHSVFRSSGSRNGNRDWVQDYMVPLTTRPLTPPTQTHRTHTIHICICYKLPMSTNWDRHVYSNKFIRACIYQGANAKLLIHTSLITTLHVLESGIKCQC